MFRGYLWVCNPQESLENTINTMGTLLGVHPIVPWNVAFTNPFGIKVDLRNPKTMPQMDLSASEKRSHPLGYIGSPFCRSFCVVPSSGAVIFWTIYDDVRQLQDLEISVGVQWYIEWWICFFLSKPRKVLKIRSKNLKSLKSHQIKHLVLSSICSIMIGNWQWSCNPQYCWSLFGCNYQAWTCVDTPW